MTNSPERSLQTERPQRLALVQRTLRSQWESPRGRHSVGDKTLVARTAPPGFQASHVGKDPSRWLRLPYKQHRSAGKGGQERGEGMGRGGGRSGPTSPAHLLFKGPLQCWESGPAIPRETSPESFPL